MILNVLQESGFVGDTLVIYTSDHGESLGIRGLWGKSVMYEESSAVPLIAAGPGLPAGKRCSTAVSLEDIYPTIVESVCGELDARERALPGDGLIALAHTEPQDRVVFSELHDDGSLTGTFMVRREGWKLVHYEDHPPQLFDLSADPFETLRSRRQPRDRRHSEPTPRRIARDRGSRGRQPACLRRPEGPDRAARRCRSDPRRAGLQFHSGASLTAVERLPKFTAAQAGGDGTGQIGEASGHGRGAQGGGRAALPRILRALLRGLRGGRCLRAPAGPDAHRVRQHLVHAAHHEHPPDPLRQPLRVATASSASRWSTAR